MLDPLYRGVSYILKGTFLKPSRSDASLRFSMTIALEILFIDDTGDHTYG